MANKNLPFEDYQRISRVIASVLDGADANTANACLFFSIVGAFILEHVYKRPARPVAGAAFFRVDDNSGFTIAYGRLDSEDVISDGSAFHCWVESEGVVIDFMAPLFQDSVLTRGRHERVARRMFQKPRSSMSNSLYELLTEGDFFMVSNNELLRDLVTNWMNRPINEDLLKICMHWYKRPPKKISDTFIMRSNDGENIPMKLKRLAITGAW